MNDDIHTKEWQHDRWHEMPLVERNRAVEFLAREFKKDPEGLEDLRQRIAEKPHGLWLMGRDDAVCWMCKGEKVLYRLKHEVQQQLDLERQRTHPGLITAEDMARAEELRKDPSNCDDPEPCNVCDGQGRAAEMPFHHGWGTGIRNLLRENGFGEKELRVRNLDDYYAVIVEKAVASCA